MTRHDRARVEGSNVPGNPLNSYRMSMIAHGFEEHDRRWKPTLNPWLRPDGLRPLPVAVTILLVVLAAVALATWLV